MGEQHTSEMLKELQAYPLDMKIWLTKQRIREWVREFGADGVYVSFSGGKDSTVLLDIVRQEYPDVPAVFVNTGLEYPEIVNFVKKFNNVVLLRPEMNFRKVIEKYGYPVISKEISKKVYECRKAEERGHESYARRQFEGVYITKSGKTNFYSVTKWEFLTHAPFKISSMCCDIMKKRPTKRYGKIAGRVPITAQMADESLLRKATWLKHGCNAFDQKRPISNPMSFWTEQDVLQYIRNKNLKIASVYGDIIEQDEIYGQMNISDFIPAESPKLTTTKCKRTGCMFCGFGCHLEKPGEGKFELLKVTHPKIYDYIMRPWDQGGLDYKNVIDWINENNGKGTIIRY